MLFVCFLGGDDFVFVLSVVEVSDKNESKAYRSVENKSKFNYRPGEDYQRTDNCKNGSNIAKELILYLTLAAHHNDLYIKNDIKQIKNADSYFGNIKVCYKFVISRKEEIVKKKIRNRKNVNK